MQGSLYGALADAAPAPDATVVITPDGDVVTYGQIFATARRFARALVELGVQPGDRVAAQVEKSPQAIALFLGVSAAGGVLLPLNTAYTRQELDFFVGDAEPRVMVATPARAHELTPLAAARRTRLETLGGHGDGSLAERMQACADDHVPATRRDADLAAILYTSGTTGRSKGAMLTNANLLSNALTLRDYWRFTANDVLLHALPIFHTHGLFVATNTIMLAGGSMLFHPAFDADQVIADLPRATTMMGVPTFYTRLLADPRLARDLGAGARLLVSGSAPLLAETHRAFEARTGHRILERYGMTETNMNTSNPYDGERRAGTVGFPLPGVGLRIADPASGRILAPGEVGGIEVRGPNVFQGYWRLPDKTREEFRDDGWFVTGDLGVVDARGYVSIVGRSKDLIISGGFNVYPAEVEALIDAIPGVAESAVVGLPHRDFGEGVTALVALKPGAAVVEGEVKDVLAESLASFKQPKRVLFVPALPRNAMGKIQKTDLRVTYASLYDT